MEGNEIANQTYRLRVDPAHGGGVVSLTAAGRELIGDGRIGNELAVYDEYPAHPQAGGRPVQFGVDRFAESLRDGHFSPFSSQDCRWRPMVVAASATATDGARRKILRCMANLCGGWGGGYGVRVPGGGPAVLAERRVWGRQRRTSRGLTG